MTTLTPLFSPRGVAVVGASRDSAKLGAAMARSLTGYRGGPLLVNSRNPDPHNDIHPSVVAAVDASDMPVDLAIICVPASACADALESAATAGVGAALVCAGGFAEVGSGGFAHQRDLHRVVQDTGIRLLGPNTSGFFAPEDGLFASFVPGITQVPSGHIAIVAASGGVNHALGFELANTGNGVSLGVGIGAGIDVTAADVLEYLYTDDTTAAVALHIESVSDGLRLVAAVRALTEVKPVVALVVGRTDVGDFARSHTGALATSWKTTRAALRQAGAVLVDDERELVDAVAALSRRRLAPSADPGVGLVTAQAGPGLLFADRVNLHGLSMPRLDPATRESITTMLPPMTFQENPVDTGRPTDTFPAVLRAVADDPQIDLLAVYALVEPGSIDLAAAAQSAGLDNSMPVVFGVGGLSSESGEVQALLRKAGFCAVSTPTAAENAIRALVEDARARVVPAPLAVASSDASGADGPFDEAQAKNFLADLGIQVPRNRVCSNHREVRSALEDLSGPVVVKMLDASVHHKTELGAVRLGIRTAADLGRALAALDEIGTHRYLVEEMVEDGVDLVVGARRDPVFGPIVMVGLGGTAAEALADVAIRLAPIAPVEAARMPDDLLGHQLLRGWRGGPILDDARLGEIVAALGGALVDDPDLADIEINPLRLTATGLVALDAVILRTHEAVHVS